MQAASAVLKCDFEKTLPASHVDISALAAGVTMDVREALLHDAEDSELDLFGQAADIRIDRQRDMEPTALVESPYVPAQGVAQTKIFEHRGMQEVAHAA